MIKVLFVCWGNICRSPMGEFILKNMVEERGIADQFFIASAATSTEEIGNLVYPPARSELAKHGINCTGHHARQVISDDYDNFDIIIAMEDIHKRIMEQRFFNGDPEHKIRMCMSLAGRPNETVDDPWYTGEFGTVYNQLLDACEGLLKEFKFT